jgi:hypothetical protein
VWTRAKQTHSEYLQGRREATAAPFLGEECRSAVVRSFSAWACCTETGSHGWQTSSSHWFSSLHLCSHFPGCWPGAPHLAPQ